MPLPPRNRTRSRKARQNRHPYIVKIEGRIEKLDKMVVKICELADCDLVVSDAITGLNDYSMNLKLARKLQDVAKALENTLRDLYDKSKNIIEKVRTAQDFKQSIQPVQFIEEVMDPKLKDKTAKNKPAERYKSSCDFPIKTEVLDDNAATPAKSTDDDPSAAKKRKRPEQFSGELDGHFVYPKENENAGEIHHFSCDICEKIFRDRNELRNHDCSHKMEFFQCLMCFSIFRSIRSFENHYLSHTKEHNCDVCGKFFRLQSSLINHKQVHSLERMHCPTCNKAFKHRQNHLEHIVWSHKDTKECPCTVCKKLFQTPTNMRTHRLRVHGPIADIVPGFPGVRNKLPVSKPSKQKREKK